METLIQRRREQRRPFSEEELRQMMRQLVQYLCYVISGF